jgi:hypothetical protein
MDERRLRHVQWALIAVWVAMAVKLMIADVWDETNGMLAFSSDAMSLGQKLKFVLTQSLGFWRPLPTLFVATVLHFVTDFDVSWRVLRVANVGMLLGSLAILLRVAGGRLPLTSRASEDSAVTGNRQLATLFTIAFLFSGSAVITAGWYANIFDAAALLLISIALLLLLRGKDVQAGLVIGIAFFCKETAALALPFLLVLFAAKHITFKQALRAGIPATILGAIYFVIRSKIVPFGGAGDVHGFAPELFLPSMLNLAESFWEQTLKSRGYLGFLWLAISLVALRRATVIAAALLFFLGTSVVYWGMFVEYQNGILIHHLDFIGRLYLVPVTLMLVLLALEKRKHAMAVLLIPIVFGAVITWRDHARFQRMYKRVYSTAMRGSVKPLTFHYPAKPLEDTVRGVKIGDIPNASVTIDPRTGRLSYR